ncbi:anti-sigma-D factor RsdA [Micromonospora sp. NPDC050495]|uniref:anti-sigma-D factor RsdA n=1 Tax=Micromonospora sp. NPDC050495 TaxID=3154936 RepID=UPI0033C8C604
MSERMAGGGDEAMDLDVLARDDLLLDALGRGEPAPAGDDLAAMLAAWHADVADEAPPLRPAAPDAEADPADAETDPAESLDATVTPLPARRPRRAVRLAAAGVALLALAGGLGVASRSAEPGGPLWSLTKVLYPQRAEVRDVEALIAQARAAWDAGRLDEARDLIDRAGRELADVTDPATAARLRAELDALARDLAAASAPPPAPAPSVATPAVPSVSPTTGPSAPRPAPSPSPRQSRPATSPAPTSSASDGGGLLPGLPLPTLPLPPLPVPSLSPLLPGLPLPTSGLLG